MLKVILFLSVIVNGEAVDLAPPATVESVEVCLGMASKFLEHAPSIADGHAVMAACVVTQVPGKDA